MAPQPIPIEVGDVVTLRGKAKRPVVRELLPDGKHAVCEQVATGSTYASYVLALKGLVKR
jgi:hypothetical protein